MLAVSKKNTYVEIVHMLSLISQLGLMMIIPILGCTFIGKYLDDKLNTRPVLVLIFLLLGVGGAFNGVYKTLKVYTKRK
ncbi:AtpZ/AtpI family protein [Asaccharospora irregularis]|uniref:AtpZ/AtpI family protein n=1 Tax=Asaccharospora irregularis TaxID=29359 RepID=UPI001FA91F58